LYTFSLGLDLCILQVLRNMKKIAIKKFDESW
ncbi:hypothetical protein T11_961, partial [Trichinella zimbabwensis]